MDPGNAAKFLQESFGKLEIPWQEFGSTDITDTAPRAPGMRTSNVSNEKLLVFISMASGVWLVVRMYWCKWTCIEVSLKQILLPLLFDFCWRVLGWILCWCGTNPERKTLRLATSPRAFCRNIVRLANLTVNMWAYDEMRDFTQDVENMNTTDVVLKLLMGTYLASMLVEGVANNILLMFEVRTFDMIIQRGSGSINFGHEIFRPIDDSRARQLSFAADSLQAVLQLLMVLLVAFSGMAKNMKNHGAHLVVKVIMDITSSMDNYLELSPTGWANHRIDLWIICFSSIITMVVTDVVLFHMGPHVGIFVVVVATIFFHFRPDFVVGNAEQVDKEIINMIDEAKKEGEVAVIRSDVCIRTQHSHVSVDITMF